MNVVLYLTSKTYFYLFFVFHTHTNALMNQEICKIEYNFFFFFWCEMLTNKEYEMNAACHNYSCIILFPFSLHQLKTYCVCVCVCVDALLFRRSPLFLFLLLFLLHVSNYNLLPTSNQQQNIFFSAQRKIVGRAKKKNLFVFFFFARSCHVFLPFAISI